MKRMMSTAVAGLFAVSTAWSVTGASAQSNVAAQQTREEQIGDWNLVCAELAGSAVGERCEMTQIAVFPTNQKLRLGAVVRQGPNGPYMILAAPLLVHLPSGLSVSIDGSEPQVVPFEYCKASSGCEVTIILDESGAPAMQRGNTLTGTYFTLEGTEVTTDISLSGFTKAFEEVSR